MIRKKTRKVKAEKTANLGIYLDNDLIHVARDIDQKSYKKIRNIIYRVLKQKLDLDNNIKFKKVS